MKSVRTLTFILLPKSQIFNFLRFIRSFCRFFITAAAFNLDGFAIARRDFPLSFWRSQVPDYLKEEGRYAGGYSSAAGHNRIAAGIAMGRLI